MWRQIGRSPAGRPVSEPVAPPADETVAALAARLNAAAQPGSAAAWRCGMSRPAAATDASWN